jgi:hypothetical protein
MVAAADAGDGGGASTGEIELKLEELEQWVRHGKFKKLRDAFAHLPARKFDDSIVRYVAIFGSPILVVL